VIADVAGRGKRPPSDFARLRGGLLRALAGEIGDCDVRSFASECESDRLADAAAGSRDECDLTPESHDASFTLGCAGASVDRRSWRALNGWLSRLLGSTTSKP